jgi:hypothetical protein
VTRSFRQDNKLLGFKIAINFLVSSGTSCSPRRNLFHGDSEFLRKSPMKVFFHIH